MFIGRQDELHFLEERYNTSSGQLIMLYGRRRIGKTEILRRFCEGKEHVFFSCTETPDELQLSAFSNRVLQSGFPTAQYFTRFTDWEVAFGSVADFSAMGKKLLVIDEFPYMVWGNKAIPSLLQRKWDEELKDKNVMIILCGSSMSFIEKEILAEKNPLYGRATGILKIYDMTFYEAIQFVPKYTAFDKITTYAVLGGVPHYLMQFNDDLSLKENIQKNVLTRGSILYNEVEFLMRQELRETAVYNSIIEAVALGNTKLNDIHQKTWIEKTKLSAYLKNLNDLNIIRREFPVSGSIKEQGNIQRGLYQVTDNFFRFWYAFVFPNMTELEAGSSEGIWNHVIEPALTEYTSRIFEDICCQYLRMKNRDGTLPFYFTRIGRWWHKDAEIDIMATDAKNQNFLLGECKYRNSAITLAELKVLKGKINFREQEEKASYFLFSKNGFSDEIIKLANAGEVHAITAEKVVEAFS